MEHWLRKAADIAAAQDALITHEQLSAMDVSAKVVAACVERGWLRRERRGVLAFAGAPRTWRQQLHAAVLAGDAVASHSCAATLWQFRHLPYLTLEVTVTRDRRVELPGVHGHHAVTPDADITATFGLPITTFERTLVDCSTVLTEFQLSANLDDGLRRRVASLRALRECVERLHAGPGRRLSIIRSLLEARSETYDPGGSREERRVLDVLTAASLPAPVQQHRVVANGNTYFLDYAYPQRRVFIEYYGVAWHGTPSAVVYDSARISDLTSQRWQPLIFTEATPDRVIVERTAAVLGLTTPETPARL
jgi:hypothetical protein